MKQSKFAKLYWFGVVVVASSPSVFAQATDIATVTSTVSSYVTAGITVGITILLFVLGRRAIRKVI